MGNSAIDAALASAVESGRLVGVSAAAWSAGGVRYEGAFGESAPGRAMQPDTVAWIASMTKAITAAAVMQLVESGTIELDQPAGDLVPYLGRVHVLEGFDDDGRPRLRPPVRPITIRHLLTHTSGFGYDWTEESLARYVPTLPEAPRGSQASYEHPLTFDPGDGWSYGIGVDWAGRVIEAVTGQRLDAWFRDRLLDPLGMHDTSFALTATQRERVATMHVRGPDGLTPMPFETVAEPEMFTAGGGLYSTAPDYLRFTRMILGGGALDGVRVLSEATVHEMSQNHIGGLVPSGWQSFNPVLTNDVELFGGTDARWSLAFLLNLHRTDEGRSAGSLAWAGLANTYYWIDPVAQVTGVFVTQVLPFFDAGALDTFSKFERAVYAAARA